MLDLELVGQEGVSGLVVRFLVDSDCITSFQRGEVGGIKRQLALADELEVEVEFVGVAICTNLHIDICWGSRLNVHWSVRGRDGDACPSGTIDISLVLVTFCKRDLRDRTVSALPASVANALAILATSSVGVAVVHR